MILLKKLEWRGVKVKVKILEGESADQNLIKHTEKICY